jgi:hypothetical protein
VVVFESEQDDGLDSWNDYYGRIYDDRHHHNGYDWHDDGAASSATCDYSPSSSARWFQANACCDRSEPHERDGIVR